MRTAASDAGRNREVEVMTIEELREKLANILRPPYDPEAAHLRCDEALLEYINDPVVNKLYREVELWYA